MHSFMHTRTHTCTHTHTHTHTFIVKMHKLITYMYSALTKEVTSRHITNYFPVYFTSPTRPVKEQHKLT